MRKKRWAIFKCGQEKLFQLEYHGRESDFFITTMVSVLARKNNIKDSDVHIVFVDEVAKKRVVSMNVSMDVGFEIMKPELMN